MIEEENQENELPRPLEGIRVVEYGLFHAGPGAGAILGDLGAEVTKIEPKDGDPERYWTRLGQLDIALADGESAMFQVSNRNKEGIGVDIQNPMGRDVFNGLIRKADIFLTNIRKSTKAKLKIDYESLSSVNPTLIHANVSGYGPEGPMSDLGAFDPLGLARSGMMFVTGTDEPVLMHIGILDQATSIALSHAIITALFVRERRGVGQEVHVSLYGTAQWLMHPTLMIGNILSVEPVIHLDRKNHSPLRNFFRCRDGEWIIGTHHPEEKYWASFCEATGQPHLISDPRYATLEARANNSTGLVEYFDQVFATRSRDEWMAIFLERGLMFCSIQHAGEVKNDPQARANDYVMDFEDPSLGNIQIPGYPIHFSACTAGTRKLAPKLGEHTRTVLLENGYTQLEIEALMQARAVF
ncbi:MAG: CoA transferase [Deltaproteobacteria bacterium]|nr:CoA transferase [Deltaproteobacteria bacterium]